MTERPGAIVVRNWDKFQHYAKRNPPWIRLYRDLLDSDEWRSLSDAAARLLVEVWLLASELKPGGKVPYDLPLLAWRTGRASTDASIAPSLQELAAQRFIELPENASTLASADASRGIRQRQIQSTEKKKPPSSVSKKEAWKFCPDDFEPTEKHHALARLQKVDFSAALDEFRDHEFKDPKTDANRAFSRWIRNFNSFHKNGNSDPWAIKPGELDL